MSQKSKSENDYLNRIQVSRNPDNYRPNSHFIQHAKERGYGKSHYVERGLTGMEDHGVQDWIIRYLIEYGIVDNSQDEDRYVFKAEIPDDQGGHEWWLPVDVEKGEKNMLKTSPYVNGLTDKQIRMLHPIKPDMMD